MHTLYKTSRQPFLNILLPFLKQASMNFSRAPTTTAANKQAYMIITFHKMMYGSQPCLFESHAKLKATSLVLPRFPTRRTGIEANKHRRIIAQSFMTDSMSEFEDVIIQLLDAYFLFPIISLFTYPGSFCSRNPLLIIPVRRSSGSNSRRSLKYVV